MCWTLKLYSTPRQIKGTPNLSGPVTRIFSIIPSLLIDFRGKNERRQEGWMLLFLQTHMWLSALRVLSANVKWETLKWITVRKKKRGWSLSEETSLYIVSNALRLTVSVCTSNTRHLNTTCSLCCDSLCERLGSDQTHMLQTGLNKDPFRKSQKDVSVSPDLQWWNFVA